MRILLPCLLLMVAGCSSPAEETTPTMVPPDAGTPRPRVPAQLIGSGGYGFGVGNAFPGATAPHGLVKLGPHTNGPWGTIEFLHEAGYWYGDDKVRGFAHTHLHGTGAGDYGLLAVMPTEGFDETFIPASGHESPFEKDSEVAEPGYYAITIDRGAIRAELTATTRAGHHRYTWPQDAGSGWLLFDLSRAIGSEIDDSSAELLAAEQRIRGRIHHVGGMSGEPGYDLFFEARTRKPWSVAHVWTADGAPTEGTTLSGKPGGFALRFEPGGTPVELQVGLSMVSQEGALANLDAEMPDWDFDATREATRATWDEILGRVRVEGGTEEQRLMLTAAVYHCFLMPSIQEDVGGTYQGHDRQPHLADDFEYVTDLSLWDTYRTLHPIYALIAPDRARDSVISLHRMAVEGGHFPKWPLGLTDGGSMVGSSADIVVADAYMRGITDFDAEGAYELLRAAALDEVPPAGGRGGRNGSESYMTLGYLPADERGGSVSVTTEWAHDDFALAELAAALGYDADETALRERSKGYRKLFDPDTGFLWSKNADGSWASAHNDPLALTDEFVEANAWHSTWMAAHDIDGLVALFGGPEAFVAKLEVFLEEAKKNWEEIPPDGTLLSQGPRPYYWAGNEPDIHAPFMFAQVGRPDLTQKWVRWTMMNLYGPGADGIPGNDDGGAMSAWWIYAAIGFYPLPGSDRYIVAAPLFPRIELAVPGGTFTVEGVGVSDANLYVQSVELNGEPLDGPEIRHSELAAGGSLVFQMGPSPSNWGRTSP